MIRKRLGQAWLPRHVASRWGHEMIEAAAISTATTLAKSILP